MSSVSGYDYKVWIDGGNKPPLGPGQTLSNDSLFLQIRMRKLIRRENPNPTPPTDDDDEDKSYLEEPIGDLIIKSYIVTQDNLLNHDAATVFLTEVLSSLGVPIPARFPMICEVSALATAIVVNSRAYGMNLCILPIVLGIAVISYENTEAMRNLFSLEVELAKEKPDQKKDDSEI